MDVREKLVELFFDAQQTVSAPYGMETEKATRCIFEQMADHLIAHGVTVQDNTQITDELLEQLRNTPVTILQEEPTIEVVQEWISVKERLPEEGMDVLAYQNRGEESRIVPANYGCSVWFDCFFDCEADHITHWMPLPPAPNEDEQ